MKVIPNLIKDKKDEWLVHTLMSLNDKNSIIDRISDDNSVLTVLFTNHTGALIYTSISVNNGTEIGRKTHDIGVLTRQYVKEVNVFDEALALRVTTKKFEIIFLPHEEFNIIVIQQPRQQKN